MCLETVKQPLSLAAFGSSPSLGEPETIACCTFISIGMKWILYIKNAPLYNFFAAHLPGFRFPEYRNLQHAFRGTGKIDNPLVDEWHEGPDGELGTGNLYASQLQFQYS